MPRWWPGLLALWITWSWVPLAIAQKVTKGPAKPTKPFLPWIAAIVLAGLCCAIAFKNPKRTHMD
jgi:hypothetical protein